jgi:hypothetical protein
MLQQAFFVQGNCSSQFIYHNIYFKMTIVQLKNLRSTDSNILGNFPKSTWQYPTSLACWAQKHGKLAGFGSMIGISLVFCLSLKFKVFDLKLRAAITGRRWKRQFKARGAKKGDVREGKNTPYWAFSLSHQSYLSKRLQKPNYFFFRQLAGLKPVLSSFTKCL